MITPKLTATPQRKARDAFQAGRREFESRPPLHGYPPIPNKSGAARPVASSPVGLHSTEGSTHAQDWTETPCSLRVSD